MFVFACCTGLRYSDLKELRWDNIQDNLLMLTNQKTKRKITVPLIGMAKEILVRQPREEDHPVFKPLTNAHYNAVLGSIAQKAGITTSLTSHIARHSFATLALTKGIAVEVVSSLLGHTSIRTTQIYAKVIDARKIEEMQKFHIGEEKPEYGNIPTLS